jgi:hypothetical protein
MRYKAKIVTHSNKILTLSTNVVTHLAITLVFKQFFNTNKQFQLWHLHQKLLLELK